MMAQSAKSVEVALQQLGVAYARQTDDRFTPLMMLTNVGDALYLAFLPTIPDHHVEDWRARYEPCIETSGCVARSDEYQ